MGGDPKETDRRAVWLRSLGWHEGPDGTWTGQVASSPFGWYAPMSLEHAFGVALKRAVIDEQFRVEVRDGRVRLVLAWRQLPYEDMDEAGDPFD